MAKNYADQPKLNFSIFENRFANNPKHPTMTGAIEFTRPFLKAMVEEAKSGTMPTVKVAMWERTTLNVIRREAQNRDISVTDMFKEIIKSYDFTGQRERLKPSETKPWWI